MPVTGDIAEFGGVNVTPGPDAVVQAVGDLATVSYDFTPMLSDDHVQTVRGILLSIPVEAHGVSFTLVNAPTDSTWSVDPAAGTLTMADTQPTSLPLGVTSDPGLLQVLPTVAEIGAAQASGAVLGPQVLHPVPSDGARQLPGARHRRPRLLGDPRRMGTEVLPGGRRRRPGQL